MNAHAYGHAFFLRICICKAMLLIYRLSIPVEQLYPDPVSQTCITHVCMQDDVVKDLQAQLDSAMQTIANLNANVNDPPSVTPPSRATATPPSSQPKASVQKPKAAAAPPAPEPTVS